MALGTGENPLSAGAFFSASHAGSLANAKYQSNIASC